MRFRKNLLPNRTPFRSTIFSINPNAMSEWGVLAVGTKKNVYYTQLSKTGDQRTFAAATQVAAEGMVARSH